MKMMVEIDDDKILKRFKLNEKKKIKKLKKVLKKYITDYNPKLESFAGCVVDVVDEVLKEDL